MNTPGHGRQDDGVNPQKEAARTVLIVDDLAIVRRLFQRTLASSGFVVLEAADGDEALQVALAEYPDVILMDLSIPKRAGFEVMRRLKGDPLTAGIPFIVVTGTDTDEARETAQELGAKGYLVKPFSPLELLDTIDGALS